LRRLNLQWDAVIDTTLSWEESARQLIADIEASGRRAVVLYVHRPFAKSFEHGVIERYLDGKEKGTPRLVPLRVAAEAHVGAQETAIALAEAGVKVSFFDNSGSAAQFTKRDIEFLRGCLKIGSKRLLSCTFLVGSGRSSECPTTQAASTIKSGKLSALFCPLLPLR
jgi:hypothetical protein